MKKNMKIIIITILIIILVAGGIITIIQLKSKQNNNINNVGNIASSETDNAENFNNLMLDYVYFLLNNGTLNADKAIDNTLVVTLFQLENEYGFNQYNTCLKEETYVTITFNSDSSPIKTDLTSVCSK